jgi:hypothetical protein
VIQRTQEISAAPVLQFSSGFMLCAHHQRSTPHLLDGDGSFAREDSDPKKGKGKGAKKPKGRNLEVFKLNIGTAGVSLCSLCQVCATQQPRLALINIEGALLVLLAVVLSQLRLTCVCVGVSVCLWFAACTVARCMSCVFCFLLAYVVVCRCLAFVCFCVVSPLGAPRAPV